MYRSTLLRIPARHIRPHHGHRRVPGQKPTPTGRRHWHPERNAATVLLLDIPATDNPVSTCRMRIHRQVGRGPSRTLVVAQRRWHRHDLQQFERPRPCRSPNIRSCREGRASPATMLSWLARKPEQTTALSMCAVVRSSRWADAMRPLGLRSDSRRFPPKPPVQWLWDWQCSGLDAAHQLFEARAGVGFAEFLSVEHALPGPWLLVH